jgi:hypothetical protein
MGRRWLWWWLVVLQCCVACALRSGEQVVILNDATGAQTALAIRFVSSAGLATRTLIVSHPQAAYELRIQGQLQRGAFALAVGDVRNPQQRVQMTPGAVVVGVLQTTSNADGHIEVHEIAENAQGGEYQLQVVLVDKRVGRER